MAVASKEAQALTTTMEAIFIVNGRYLFCSFNRVGVEARCGEVESTCTN